MNLFQLLCVCVHSLHNLLQYTISTFLWSSVVVVLCVFFVCVCVIFFFSFFFSLSFFFFFGGGGGGGGVIEPFLFYYSKPSLCFLVHQWFECRSFHVHLGRVGGCGLHRHRPFHRYPPRVSARG